MPIVVVMLAIIGLAASVGPASAEITYPWCAQYGNRGGARNCGFSTWEQCRAALSGNGGYCIENPMYQPVVSPGRHRRR
jgi:hypothetical protein